MNDLQFEKSPYLLQHKEQPVNWMPWGTKAFAKAEAENKPVFLSIGYSTCHWCHVMAHESFESQVVAEALNKSFVSIKVDREERPDIDSVYMAACMAANGSGGWPLSVLMTPDKKPFWVGTYLRQNEFLNLIRTAAQLWQQEPEKLLSQGDALTEHLKGQQEAAPVFGGDGCKKPDSPLRQNLGRIWLFHQVSHGAQSAFYDAVFLSYRRA